MSSNITWHRGDVGPAERRARFGHGGAAVWFTGLSGSGKSTIAYRVERDLIDEGVFTYVLDGDNVRHGLNGDLGFAPEDRQENIRRIGELARLFVDAGAVVLCAFVSPYRADRDRVRGLLEPKEFIEVHVATDLATCEARDPKGLYRRARAGEIPNFTGISAPYEAPLQPEVVVDTATQTVSACSAAVVDALQAGGIVSAG